MAAARAAVAAAALACTIGLAAAGQGPASGASGAVAAQTKPAAGAPGVPDITGSWERVGPGALGRGQGTDTRTPPPVPPPPLKAAYLGEWRARQQAAREATAKGQPIGINWVNCLPDGMPGMMQGPFPMEILQSKGQVTIIQESFTQVRRILLDRPQKAFDEVDPSFYGHSVGRWVGDTLLVDTIGVKEQAQYQNVPHSDRMRLTERIRLVAPDRLWGEDTIEAPVTLEKSSTFKLDYCPKTNY